MLKGNKTQGGEMRSMNKAEASVGEFEAARSLPWSQVSSFWYSIFFVWRLRQARIYAIKQGTGKCF